MYQLDVLEAPVEAPLTMEQAKMHLRVEHDEEDVLITLLIESARLQAEMYLWRALVTREYRLTQFLKTAPKSQMYYLPMAPIGEVTLVEADGVAVEGYELFETAGVLKLPSGTTISETLVVEYTAGYGGAAAVPANFKQAMLLMIGHWYENREAVVLATQPAKLPLAVESLLKPYRAWRPE